MTTGRYAFAFSRREAPEACKKLSPSIERAQGKPGADCTRGRAQSARVDHRATGSTRLSPRGGLRLIRALPGVTSSLAPVALELTMQPKPGRARCISQDLAPAWGAGTTRLHRPRPFSLNAPPGLAAQAKFWRTRLAAPFVARRIIAHKPKAALRSLARPTLSRPSHPTARS
jgi:hypothetical protein